MHVKGVKGGGVSRPATRLFALLLLSMQLVVFGQEAGREALIRKIERTLGSKSKAYPDYFDLNGGYLAKVAFGEDGRLTVVKVAPWYYADPDREADEVERLTFKQYRELVKKLDSIEPLGSLAKKGSYGLVTNATKVPVVDRYENAFIYRAVVQRSESNPEQVTFFSVYFIHRVEGLVEEKKAYEGTIGDGEGAYRVKIDGNWYYVTKQQYELALQNTRLTLECAGPID